MTQASLKAVAALAGSVLLSGTLSAQAPPAAAGSLKESAAALRARGLELGFNLDHAEALVVFREAIAADPNHPAAYRLAAATLWTGALFDQGAVTAEDFLGQAGATPRRPAQNADLSNALREALHRADAFAAARARTASAGDPEASYQKGAAYALLATYTATVEGSLPRSLGPARRAYREHQRALDLDPYRMDAGLIVGMYRYAVSTLPGWSRLLAHLAGFGGGRDRGLRLVEDAATYPGDAQANARFPLIVIYQRESPAYPSSTWKQQKTTGKTANRRRDEIGRALRRLPLRRKADLGATGSSESATLPLSEDSMYRRVTYALLAAVLLGSGAVVAQSRATATNVAVIPHEAVANFFKNPPGIYTGENMGIATNSKGNIYIYHRANETRLFEYSPQGAFVREIGRHNYGFAFAHSVRVDSQDNIWAVDEGTDMLIKFSPEGKVLMTIGRREDPVTMLANMPGGGRFHGRNAKYRFGRETDVAFDQQGNIFVSDGYFDARVVKYDKNGRFIKAVGKQGRGNLEFNTPHSIATDFQGNVYVGDRGNARVQVLDNDLNWKANYPNVGNPWAVCVSGGPGPKNPGKQYLYVSNSWPDSAPAGPAEFTGEVYKMELDGTIVGKFGRAGKAPGEFATIHQMDCRDPDVIFTAEINNWRSQKILLKPQAMKTTSQQ